MPDRDSPLGAPRGTRDLLPPGSLGWQALTRQAMDLFARSGYLPIETPIFEHTEVFERGVGATSEVVGKQMYTFTDRGERSLSLRPEMTAPVMRAVLEHRLDKGALPVKLAYAAPMFRQERPQKGRYRQFWQLGIESIGLGSHLVDAEVIEVALRLFRSIDLPVTLVLNSIGHPAEDCRLGYVGILQAFLRENVESLDPEDRERIDLNPLRTFDSKLEKTRALMASAPLISEHLCNACREHHEALQAALEALGIVWKDDPRMVRGLDYYTRTAFEFVAEGLGSQDSVGGGGRYDGLSEILGGPALPGIGFALGLDRMVLALGESTTGPFLDAYLVTIGEEAMARGFRLMAELRDAGLGIDMDLAGRGMKGQMKDASRSGARYAVILGEDELKTGTATVKDLTSGEQASVPLQELKERLER